MSVTYGIYYIRDHAPFERRYLGSYFTEEAAIKNLEMLKPIIINLEDSIMVGAHKRFIIIKQETVLTNDILG